MTEKRFNLTPAELKEYMYQLWETARGIEVRDGAYVCEDAELRESISCSVDAEAATLTPQPTGEIGELLDTIMDMLQPYHEYEKLKANIAMSQVHKTRTAFASLERELTKIEEYVEDVERNICRGEKRPDGFTATDILIFLHQQATIIAVKQCTEIASLERERDEYLADHMRLEWLGNQGFTWRSDNPKHEEGWFYTICLDIRAEIDKARAREEATPE